MSQVRTDVKSQYTYICKDFIEPTIRSNTPSEPEQNIHAKGRGAKLFRKRQERMNSYTKSSQGKASGLPTGKLNDRQRCGYAAKTKVSNKKRNLNLSS